MEVDLKDFSQTADPVIPDISSQPGEVDDLSYLDPIKNGVLDALLRIEINTQPKKNNSDFREISGNLKSLTANTNNNNGVTYNSKNNATNLLPTTPKKSKTKEVNSDKSNPSSLVTSQEEAINRSKQTAENYLKMELANLKKSEYFANESIATNLIGANEVVNTTKTIDSNEASKTTKSDNSNEVNGNNAVKYSAIKSNNSTKKPVSDKEKTPAKDAGKVVDFDSLEAASESAINRSKQTAENYLKMELANLKKSEYFANESIATNLIGANEVVNTTKTIDSNEASKTTKSDNSNEVNGNNAVKYSAIKSNNSTKKPVSDKEKTPAKDAGKVVDFDSLEAASESAINRSKQTAENYLKMELANLKKSEYFANESIATNLIGANEVVNTTKTIDSNEASKTTKSDNSNEVNGNNAVKYSAIKSNNSTKKPVSDKEKTPAKDAGKVVDFDSLEAASESAINRSKQTAENYLKMELANLKKSEYFANESIATNLIGANEVVNTTKTIDSNEASKTTKSDNSNEVNGNNAVKYSAIKSNNSTKKPVSDKEKPPTRDASGRFLPKADKGEKALEETKENKRNKSLSDTIKDAVIGKDGVFSEDKSGGSDDIGNAAGGTFYGAFKEMKGVYDKFSDPENPVLKAFSDIKENTFGEGEKQPSASDSGEDLIKNELTDISESSRDVTELVSKVSSKTEDLESTLEIKNSITEQTTKQEKNHGIIAKLLKKIGRSSRGGGGDGFSLGDILGNKKTRGRSPRGRSSRSNTPRGRPATPSATPTPKAGGGVASRIGGAVAEKTGGIASKAGGLAKGALGFGSKALGALAAPIAGIMSFSSKKEELSTRDDLTESQKTTQAAATGIGAGGGALAGAAMGAAVGSVIPFVGTLIGGVVGGIVGAYGGEWIGEKAGEAIAGGDGSDAKAKTEDVVSESENDLLASNAEAKEDKKEVKKEAQEEAKQDNGTENKESNLEFTPITEAGAIDSLLNEVAIKEMPVSSAGIKEVGGGFTANELLASEISAPEKLTTKASKQVLSSTEKSNQQGFDSKLIAIELAKIIKSSKEPGGQEKKTDKPSSVSATNIIPAEFDDTLMALISHDRV